MAPKREALEPLTLATFRPESASPEEVGQLIQHRLSQVEAEIKEHTEKLESLRDERKRWLGVSASPNGTASLREVSEGAALVPTAVETPLPPRGAHP